MNREVHLGKIGIVLVVFIGFAMIVFHAGKRNIEQTIQMNSGMQVASKVETVEKKTYKNDTYGFGVVFLARAATMTECDLDSTHADNPITEFVFADKAVECAKNTKQAEDAGFYPLQGGRLETMVFNLKKCRDEATNKAERDFCATYMETSATDGRADQGWPSGRWTKSGDFLTFYFDLLRGENSRWKQDYKFLVLVR